MEAQAKSGGLYSGLMDLDDLMDKGANKSCPQSKQTVASMQQKGGLSHTHIFQLHNNNLIIMYPHQWDGDNLWEWIGNAKSWNEIWLDANVSNVWTIWNATWHDRNRVWNESWNTVSKTTIN